MSFNVTDGATEYIVAWFGMGSDYTVPDKALYKAITSGHKYFVSKLFCIGEGNEDSEHETEEPAKPANKPAQRPAPQAPAQHAPIVPAAEMHAEVVTEWPADFIQEMVTTYKAAHANQIKNALKGSCFTPANGVEVAREWMAVYKEQRNNGADTVQATKYANEYLG